MFDITKLKSYPYGKTVDELKSERPKNKKKQELIEKFRQRLLVILKSRVKV